MSGVELFIDAATIEELQSEIRRLRAALESVAESYDLIDAVEYARKALANEERQ